MANTFLAIPAPASNGAGSPVDVSSFGAIKTVVCSGSWILEPTINIEINNASDPNDGSWQSIATFQGSGGATLSVACRWARARVTNYRSGQAPVCGIGSTDDGTDFATLVAPASNGDGAQVDVSSLPQFKTVQVSGSFRGSVVIEISLDGGATWGTQMSFSTPGYQSAAFVADFMRVSRNGVPQNSPGLPEINIGACSVGAGGGGVGTVHTNSTLVGVGSVGNPLGNAALFSVTDFGAVGDGTTDDTVAIQACINAALAATTAEYVPTIWFPRPPVEYKITQVDATQRCLAIAGADLPAINQGHVKIGGDNSRIRFPSTAAAAFYVTDAPNFVGEGLYFVGDADTSYLTNNKYAFFFPTNCIDVTINRCTFFSCSPIIFGSDGSQAGRATVANCKMLECPNSLNVPYYSTITACYFFNDARLFTRSHGIYIFGPADGCTISQCKFKNIDKEAIQIRASDARYNLKRGFSIVNNYFESCSYGVWVGSDSTCEVGSVTITGNEFKNCGSAIAANGCRDCVISSNTVEQLWDQGADDSGIATSSIYVSSGGEGHPSIPSSVRVENNKSIIRHPYFGIIKLNSIPTAGQTVTVGSPPNNGRTYTWTNSGSPGVDQVQIGVGIRLCIENLGTTLRGQNINNSPMNRVLRDEQDAFWSPFNYDSDVSLLIVASRYTFAMSTTAGGTTITQPVDNRQPTQGIAISNCMWPSVLNNTVQDFNVGISVAGCVSPLVANNTMAGNAISGSGNAFPVYRDNRFLWTPTREVERPRPYRWLLCGSDGFAVLDNNGLVTGQETQCIPLSGKTGIVGAGDGKARTYFYYGIDQYGAGGPETLPFSWRDGDNVFIDDGTTQTFSADFHRDTPGAGQFNSADSLIALINTGGVYTAAYVPFVDIAGGTADPKVMIEIKLVAGGVAGNAHRIYWTRLETPNQWSYRSVAQLLRYNPLVDSLDQELFSRFRGGAVTATKTVVFSPIASEVGLTLAQGVDVASQALAPIVYTADVLNGVCFTITHTVATGTEKFVFDVATP